MCLFKGQPCHWVYWCVYQLCDVILCSNSCVDESQERGRFLSLPGALELSASVGFNPKAGSLEGHSLTTSLKMGELFLAADVIDTLLNSLRTRSSTEKDSAPSYTDEPLPTSPLSPLSPYSHSYLSPGASSFASPTSLYSADIASSSGMSPRSSFMLSPTSASFLAPGSPHPEPTNTPLMQVLSVSPIIEDDEAWTESVLRLPCDLIDTVDRSSA